MTLTKAIEISTICHGHGGIAHNKDYINAQKLGIEAMKAISDYRSGLVVDFLLPLPGETED